MRRLRIKPVTIKSHPNFYQRMEELRKIYTKNNINLSQMELTNIISKNIKIPKINIMGGKIKNVTNKKQKR